MKNNIDEDIKEKIILLKDFIEGNFERDKLENYKGSYKMGYFYYSDIKQAISNVLSELEELRKYDIRKIEFKNGMIEKAPSFTKREIELMNLGISLNETTEKSELETYKKIAEKLAEHISGRCHYIDAYSNSCDVIEDSCYEDKDCKKCIIDWARKEVEKDE